MSYDLRASHLPRTRPLDLARRQGSGDTCSVVRAAVRTWRPAPPMARPRIGQPVAGVPGPNPVRACCDFCWRRAGRHAARVCDACPRHPFSSPEAPPAAAHSSIGELSCLAQTTSSRRGSDYRDTSAVPPSTPNQIRREPQAPELNKTMTRKRRWRPQAAAICNGTPRLAPQDRQNSEAQCRITWTAVSPETLGICATS